jgi:N-acetylmuramoyl-L-alanine amidase
MVLWEMAQIRHVDHSARLAEIVEQELGRRVPVSARSVQQAPFRVLVGANMPAVLVELGSLWAPEEERRLTSAAFQNAVVEAIVASILRFRDHVERAVKSAPDLDESSRAGAALQVQE